MHEINNQRRLIAVLACRADSTRLYAKPLQNLAPSICVLDQKLDTLEACPDTVAGSIIAIASGQENLAYQQYAEQRGAPYIFGSKADILGRLSSAALYADATDVLRLTSENPFIWWEQLASAWERHLADDNDLTVTDGCPWGSYFEIIRLPALLQANRHAQDYQREACTQYFRDNPERFRIQVITPPEDSWRLDVRLSIDNPEDLVVCRRLYATLRDQAPLVPMQALLDAWDADPSYANLLRPYTTGKGIWVSNKDCAWAGRFVRA